MPEKPDTATPAPFAPPTSPSTATGTTATPGAPGTPQSLDSLNANSTDRSVNEFQGDDIGQVLRLLARQANINLVVSEKVTGTVTMRLSNVTPLKAIQVVCTSKNLNLDEIDGVYYVKTPAEKAQEATVSEFYTFSYASAKDVLPLLTKQLQSKVSPQFDPRTNTVFYRAYQSNLPNIKKFLTEVDTPTKQVMIEARLVEVTANPKQSYGINWGGVVGSSSNPQTFRYGGSTVGTNTVANAMQTVTNPITGLVTTQPLLNAAGLPVQAAQVGTLPGAVTNSQSGTFQPQDFLRNSALSAIGGQFAILSIPQMSATVQFLNEDSDAEFLSNPRVVTANNKKASIEITRNQPVPELTFNQQTAQSVFSGFQDKKYGNTLDVTPTINKDSFVTLNVQPTISNKVGDQIFQFPGGSTVSSPIIDTRKLDSNVVIKSGDTLAIGGLMQDEESKSETKVPVLGDIPVLGYLFQSHDNVRTKRNLLVFITPTIIRQGYGTGLEDQVNGLKNVGGEYADPNGWRNNAKGAIRLVPTSHRALEADYPMPGTPLPPEKVKYRTSVTGRE